MMLDALLERKSTLSSLLKATAYVLRCVDIIASRWKRESEATSVFKQPWFAVENWTSKYIVPPQEIQRAKMVWAFMIQRKYYAKVYNDIEKAKMRPKHPLVKLHPIVAQGIIRVGGRLKHSLLRYEQKHPIILPSDSRFSLLLAQDCHARTLHGGTQLTLSTLRLNYWILRGRQLVKTVIRRCVACIRYRATESYQQMGNLPSVRIRPSRPFRLSGVDYAGPYAVRAAPGRGRGRVTYKCYICIFICLSTKAVHLELVAGYDSLAFIAAFRRFTSRRGHCELLKSDQGTTLVGADKELQKMYQASSEYSKQLGLALAQEGTKWEFNPPAAPNFGGVWEAAVKSVKHHIKRVIGENRLTFEEFITLLCQVEACLSSRPLLALTDDSSDMRPLTPAHFLIQSESYLVPEEDLVDKKVPAGKRWQMLQQMLQVFWKHWSRDYLQSLQARGKWATVQRSLKVGDIVLVRDEITPPAKWPLAKITEVFPGDDGLARVVNVRLSSTDQKTSYLKRPVSKIILMIPADN